MPELPEVEMVRRQLTNKIIGKLIADIEVRSWKSVGNDRYFAKELVGQEIKTIERKGKYLFFGLSGHDSFLIGHLKMTGRLIFQSSDKQDQYGGGHRLSTPKKKQPHEHTRIIFSFKDGSHLFFNDMRKFGYIKRVSRAEVAEQKAALGVEPISDDYKEQNFKDILQGRRTSIKAALLKQSDVAGLGNIYVDEACWRARIRPDRVAGDLSVDEVTELFTATRSVLNDAIEYGGTTFRDYADTGGEHGNFTDKLAVFGREGEQCQRCGEEIEKSRVAGRGTHICPGCQV